LEREACPRNNAVVVVVDDTLANLVADLDDLLALLTSSLRILL